MLQTFQCDSENGKYPIEPQRHMKPSLLAFLGITSLVTSPAEASTTIYTDRTSFEASLGASVTDDYSNPGYSFIQSNASMSKVRGETAYASTGFLPNEINIVDQGYFYYCGGCNGSFILSFTTTSVGTSDGVFGVGFEFYNASLGSSPDLLYNAFITFGDNNQQNIPLQFAVLFFPFNTFFGITSERSIKTIAFGLPNGQITNQGSFGIDNLTIGKPVPGPLPLLGVGAAFGFSRKLRKRIKSVPPIAVHRVSLVQGSHDEEDSMRLAN